MVARLFLLRDMYDDAKSELEGILAIDPTFSEAYVDLGRIEARQNRFDTSLAAFRKAIELNPGSEVARIHLGNSLIKLGRYSEAEGELKRALEIDPDNQTALSMLEDLEREGNAADHP